MLNFILRFVALKAYWVFPLVYLLFSMLSFVIDRQGGSFSIYALILWTILGTLVYAVSNSWMSHELDMEELDFVGLDEVDDPDNMKRHLQDFFVGMSYWERLFWVLIVVCLVALVYMTAGGMNNSASIVQICRITIIFHCKIIVFCSFSFSFPWSRA